MPHLKNSVLWSVFDRIDDAGKLAECKICSATYSYKATTGNLKAHLRKRHPEAYRRVEAAQAQQRRETMPELLGGAGRAVSVARESDGNQTSGSHDEDAEDSGGVWSYYEHLPSGRGRCVVCRATVARGGLKGHLRSHHPKLVAEVDLGSDEEVSDSQEDVYTEVVYLEEEQNAKKAKSVLKKKTKPTSSIERPEPRKRQASSSSDEIPLKQKKTEDNDEIEQFGKYVTCLLRKIPPAECMELQGEIINLIMKKQLELKRKTLLLTGADKMAASESPSVMSFENTPSTSNSLSCNNGYPNTTYTKE